MPSVCSSQVQTTTLLSRYADGDLPDRHGIHINPIHMFPKLGQLHCNFAVGWLYTLQLHRRSQTDAFTRCTALLFPNNKNAHGFNMLSPTPAAACKITLSNCWECSHKCSNALLTQRLIPLLLTCSISPCLHKYRNQGGVLYICKLRTHRIRFFFK